MCQFSLGNSFWIHPLVELSVIPSIYLSILLHGIRYLLVAGIFWWRGEGVLTRDMAAMWWYRRYIYDIMISGMWCHAMISGMWWCHAMILGMWWCQCHAMISGMWWCHAMISGMWWCHAHHDIGYVMMSCPCYWHYGMLCRHITSSCNDSLKSKDWLPPLRLTSAILKEHRCHFIPKRCDDIGIYRMSCHDIDGNMMSCHDNICDFMPW